MEVLRHEGERAARSVSIGSKQGHQRLLQFARARDKTVAPCPSEECRFCSRAGACRLECMGLGKSPSPAEPPKKGGDARRWAPPISVGEPRANPYLRQTTAISEYAVNCYLILICRGSSRNKGAVGVLSSPPENRNSGRGFATHHLCAEFWGVT